MRSTLHWQVNFKRLSHKKLEVREAVKKKRSESVASKFHGHCRSTAHKENQIAECRNPSAEKARKVQIASRLKTGNDWLKMIYADMKDER